MSNFLSNLPKTTAKSKKRLGRGYGSGKGGHTVGRGQKGQKSRTKIPLLFTGTKNKKSFIQRTPVLRGKSKLKPLKPKPIVVNLSDLNQFKKNSEVNVKSLVQAGLIKEKEARKKGVKVLSNGRLKQVLKVAVFTSKSAKVKIEEAGGEVVSV